MENREQLTEQLVGLIERMSAQMRSRSPVEWSELELTMPQARTLFLLSQGPQRMGRIASDLGCGMSSATSMIDRLVGKGLVRRAEDPSDRRVVACRLTAEGDEVVERFMRIGRMRMEAIAEAMTVEEIKVVVRAMEIMSEAVRRLGEGETAVARAKETAYADRE